MTRNPINLEEKLSTFREHWSPKSVASFNGHDVMVVKVQGEFILHKYDDTDDYFLMHSGKLTIHFRDEVLILGPGELCVIPKGVERCTSANVEAHLLLIEPVGTPNTGDVSTAAVVEKI